MDTWSVQIRIFPRNDRLFHSNISGSLVQPVKAVDCAGQVIFEDEWNIPPMQEHMRKLTINGIRACYKFYRV